MKVLQKVEPGELLTHHANNSDEQDGLDWLHKWPMCAQWSPNGIPQTVRNANDTLWGEMYLPGWAHLRAFLSILFRI